MSNCVKKCRLHKATFRLTCFA